MSTIQQARTSSTLPADASTVAARVAVTNGERAVAFHEQVTGLVELGRAPDGSVQLGAPGGDVALELSVEPNAKPMGRTAGLYHVALLYPSRLELARVGQRISASGVPIQGASDHGTHEAFYLADPDGNGFELAADRPTAQWPSLEAEFARGGPQPLDLASLFDLVADTAVTPHAAPGVRVGHVHLHVGDIDEALAFYRDVVGFELQARMPSAAFVSAGGYHHHLGLNTWHGDDAPPADPRQVGLRWWSMRVSSTRDLDNVAARLTKAGLTYERVAADVLTVDDPWGVTLRFTTDA